MKCTLAHFLSSFLNRLFPAAVVQSIWQRWSLPEKKFSRCKIFIEAFIELSLRTFDLISHFQVRSASFQWEQERDQRRNYLEKEEKTFS